MANVEGQADPLLFVIYHFPFVIFELLTFARPWRKASHLTLSSGSVVRFLVMRRSFTKCPSCRASLPVEQDAAYCNACDLHLVGLSTRGKRFAAYALSLPERMSRMLVGSAAGLLKGFSEFILPDAVRKTKLYHVLLQKNLRYLI